MNRLTIKIFCFLMLCVGLWYPGTVLAQGCDWEWSHVYPSSATYTGLWGYVPGGYYCSGSGSMVFNYSGSGWSDVSPFRSDDVTALWGISPGEVYGVSGNSVLLYDGMRWNTLSYTAAYELHDIWGTSPTDLYVAGGEQDTYNVGDWGVIAHYDGTTWIEETSYVYNFRGIWGSSSTDIYAVGTDWDENLIVSIPYIKLTGGVFHYDGTSWSHVMELSGLNDVWGSGPDDVFAVGNYYSWVSGGDFLYGANLYHYDGSTWESMVFPSALTELRGVWGTTRTNVYSVGSDDTFNGRIIHYDGGSWTDELTLTYYLTNIMGTSANDIVAVGAYGQVWQYGGIDWQLLATGFITDRDIKAVWGTSPTDIFAAGGHYDYPSRILHYDGISWSDMMFDAPYHIYDIWGTASSNVYAVGGGWEAGACPGFILHYDGASWTLVESCETLYGIWGISSTDIYAVGTLDGSTGYVLHYDGVTWTHVIETSDSAELYDVWGTAHDNVYAAGADGGLFHYNGLAWIIIPTGTTFDLRGIWGDAPDSIFVAGYDGKILHFNGSTWEFMPSGTFSRLHGVWGNSSTDLYVAGEDGILHYDGITWEFIRMGFPKLFSIYGFNSIDVFAGGIDGSILKQVPCTGIPAVSSAGEILIVIFTLCAIFISLRRFGFF